MLTDSFAAFRHALHRAARQPNRAPRLYLAVPYTVDYSRHSQLWETIHFQQVTLAASVLIRDGFTVFSPITHSHTISTLAAPDLVHRADIWLPQDEQFLQWADALVLLKLEYWNTSSGVVQERLWAKELSIPLYIITMSDIYDLEEHHYGTRKIDVRES